MLKNESAKVNVWDRFHLNRTALHGPDDPKRVRWDASILSHHTVVDGCTGALKKRRGVVSRIESEVKRSMNSPAATDGATPNAYVVSAVLMEEIALKIYRRVIQLKEVMEAF